jgi:predicted ATPase
LAQLVGIVVPAEALKPSSVIIEEPEVNLHADAQLRVAEYLSNFAKLKKARLLLTTHSNYFIAKLALLYAKREIPELVGYAIDNDGLVERLPMDKVTGSMDMPKSIEHALESLAAEAMKLTGEQK